MASSEELSYAFLEAHPADAARVLERPAPGAEIAQQRDAGLLAQLPTAPSG
ncbi:MAG: hypothetical protein IH606_16925 [Burkholderiales bacterium]|nr:hypothetical protein [Burkholderiales bacterium]